MLKRVKVSCGNKVFLLLYLKMYVNQPRIFQYVCYYALLIMALSKPQHFFPGDPASTNTSHFLSPQTVQHQTERMCTAG